MKIKTMTLGTMLMACSAVAMAQSTGGDSAGQGSGLTRTQANSVTMTSGAMGNASGQPDSQGVGNMSSSNDAVSPVSTDTATTSSGHSATSTPGNMPMSDYQSTTATQAYPSAPHSTGMANSGPSVPATRDLKQLGE